MQIIQPNRVTRSYTQHLVAAPEVVFPLLCPVREAQWIEGWDPLRVYTVSGFAENDCVFITSAKPFDAVWYITRHCPESGYVEMIKITPAVTACRLAIELRIASQGCDAQVTYTHTSLGEAGDEFLASFTEDFYLRFMRDWEASINRYLLQTRAVPRTRTGRGEERI